MVNSRVVVKSPLVQKDPLIHALCSYSCQMITLHIMILPLVPSRVDNYILLVPLMAL